MNKPLPHYCRSKNGSIFIVVLVVSLGLVSLAVCFGHSMIIAYRGSDNELAGRQADQAIEGAARYAQYLMTSGSGLGTFPDPASYQSEAVPVGEAAFWYIGQPTPTDPTDQPVFGLVDEASKININTAPLNILLKIPGMTAELAAAIESWHKPASSSATTVSSAPVKHADFETIRELALLTGTDQSILYGEDRNLNHALESEEADNSKTVTAYNQNSAHGLLEYVTVFSREPNTKSDGTTIAPRVDISNSGAVRGYLNTALGAGNSAKTNSIMTSVYGGPPPAPWKVPPGSVLEFYWRCQNFMTDAEFDKISNDLTWVPSTSAFIPGLINVNTASEAVLACIPGLSTKASLLVAARQSRTTPSTNLAWLVAALSLTATEAAQAGPYLTARTFQFSADVAAIGHQGRGYRRTQFVLDSSTRTPRIVYRRDLAPLGWALGANARASVAASKDLFQ